MTSRRSSGFTLVEAILVISVIGILALATAVVIGPVLDTWALDTPLNEATDSTTFTLNRMLNEIAQIKDNTSVLTAEAGRFRFTDVTDTAIDYQISGGNLVRNADILARGVQTLTFTYYDVNGAALAVPAVSPAVTDLWRVQIRVTVQKDGRSVTLDSQVHPRNFPRG